jgi:hypothetical protein
MVQVHLGPPSFALCVHHAIGGLDQAIRELRNTAYGLGPATGPPAHDTGPQ